MSKYLIFYTKSKNCDMPTDLVTFGRSTEMYQYFVDCFKLDSEFTPIRKEDLREVQNIIASDMYKNKRRLETYEKYAHINADLVEEVIGIKEHIGELTKTKMYIDFLMLIAQEAEANYSNLLELGCAIG
jgi:ketopantoate reductase